MMVFSCQAQSKQQILSRRTWACWGPKTWSCLDMVALENNYSSFDCTSQGSLGRWTDFQYQRRLKHMHKTKLKYVLWVNGKKQWGPITVLLPHCLPHTEWNQLGLDSWWLAEQHKALQSFSFPWKTWRIPMPVSGNIPSQNCLNFQEQR